MSEIDFEMRTLMLTPSNIAGLAEFFDYIFEINEDYDLKIVYYYRYLTLLGSSVIQNSSVSQKIKKWSPISKLYQYTSEVVERIALRQSIEWPDNCNSVNNLLLLYNHDLFYLIHTFGILFNLCGSEWRKRSKFVWI